MDRLSVFLLIFFSILFSACASSERKMLEESSLQTFLFEDKGDQFVLKRENKFLQDKNYYMTKSELELADSDEATEEGKEEKKNLESSVILSVPGKMKDTPMLRPYLSQHHVWLEGARYSTEILLNVTTKKLDVKLRSPEDKWNGNKSYSLPKGTGAFCFYSQLAECIKFTGFLEKAVDNEGGAMNLHIIWDSFPYFMEQYSGVPSTPFSAAQVQYEGFVEKQFHRFSVEHNDQTLYLLFDKKYQFMKLLWVSQGLSIVRE